MLTIDAHHTAFSSVLDIMPFSTSLVTVDHVLCDRFFFSFGNIFSSRCHINAACRFWYFSFKLKASSGIRSLFDSG